MTSAQPLTTAEIHAANAERPHILGMTPERVVDHAASLGVEFPIKHARRLLARRMSYVPGQAPAQMIAKHWQAFLDEHFDHAALECIEKTEDPHDGFVKYLFRSPDGSLHEAVRIPLHKPGCFTVCLSSQVGCAMKCDFCATGRLGLKRNLAAWEMVAAFLHVRDEAAVAGGRVTGAVFMGQGEPFHNYDEVIGACYVLCDPCGARISNTAITISTVGLVPQIRRFAADKHRFKLIVSLTSADEAKRRQLLPVAGRFTLAEVAGALREVAASAKGLITVAWVVMGGVNTQREEALALKELLGDLPLRINLIDVNDARPDGYRRASPEELSAFMDHLQILGAPVVRRYSGGKERHAACGMLAATRWDASTTPAAGDAPLD